MLNSGLGFSDEFEMEACSYSAKSSSKFMQQYREWTYTMRKESSAFFRSVKDKVREYRVNCISWLVLWEFMFRTSCVKGKNTYYFILLISFGCRQIQQ